MVKQFFGKYRGRVVDNIDPTQQGHLKVVVPSITNDHVLVAMPCVPYAGKSVGLYLIPPVQANIWVEFEGGDINFPIWTGCYWGTGELPKEALSPNVKLLKTEKINFELSEQANPAITIQANTASPAKIVLNDQGITITNSKATVELTNANMKLSFASASIQLGTSVSINNGALEII